MVVQGAFGTDFYDRSTRTIVDTILWTEYRPVIKIGPEGALGSHKIRPINSAPSLGQSIPMTMVKTAFLCDVLIRRKSFLNFGYTDVVTVSASYGVCCHLSQLAAISNTNCDELRLCTEKRVSIIT